MKIYVWEASNSYVDAVACYEVLNCSTQVLADSTEPID